ncbi:MAG: hypothetical protein MI892_01790 [Desulfobacterales bacterium]|nr:hypothetical protein [Desulfobacterales bacterium]
MVSTTRTKQLFGENLNLSHHGKTNNTSINLLGEFSGYWQNTEEISKKVLALITEEVEAIECDDSLKVDAFVTISDSVLFSFLSGMSDELRNSIIESLIQRLIELINR